ncbi:MAG TPA: NAD(P)-dependent alcohol dehydrogenase [Spirochaetia bacterium]|nr:NAD(P)-dependent alcohol dehydrogenase [Spirochaetia bacterium]
MEALVLERKGEIALRDVPLEEPLGPRDVRVALRNVGVCGSDVHYYTHGAIGPFIVREPMILGHEASGVVVEAGGEVTGLAPGDRVCMEPGIPDPRSRASRLGMYNLDPSVRFWATPPIHGVTRPTVVHPAEFTFKLPDNVSLQAGAMVEPLAVGMHAANKAGIAPGDVAVVIGAGTIGLVTIMSALAGGCSEVIALDVKQPKLDIAATLGAVRTVNVRDADPEEVVREVTGGWGVDIVFEASGAPPAMGTALELLRPGGRLIAIGMPLEPVPYDLVAAQAKEVRMETIFRYANVYGRAVKLLGSGAINLDPLVTETYPFEKGREAYEYAVEPAETSVKIQIEMPS